jgi:hypothetical protein
MEDCMSRIESLERSRRRLDEEIARPKEPKRKKAAGAMPTVVTFTKTFSERPGSRQ